MDNPAEHVDSETHANPTNVERELHRWFGSLVSQLDGKVSPDVAHMLDDARLNLNRILNAAHAAKQEI